MLNRNVKNGDGQQIEKGAKAKTLAFALHFAHLFVNLTFVELTTVRKNSNTFGFSLTYS